MKKYRASKCEIKEVSIKEQKEFLTVNHVQGYTPCSVCLGLYYNDKLVYLESFGAVRRKNISYATWDLKRMCGLKDGQIYGGASKLLKYFCENYDIGKGIVTYCDPEVFDGHTYNKIGFKYHHTNPRDYKYIKNNKEYNKQYGMKANILKRHPEWKTLNLTEKEMMEKDGFERVYHKGVISYTYGCNPDYQIYVNTTKRVKCLETGEVHTKEEWNRLGYLKAYDCARKVRYTNNGYHFVFETSNETLKDILDEEKIERIINEINRRNKLSKPLVISYLSKEELVSKSRSEGIKKQKETIVKKIHEMGYLTLKEMTAWTERQKRAQEPDFIYCQYKCFKPERNVSLK